MYASFEKCRRQYVEQENEKKSRWSAFFEKRDRRESALKMLKWLPIVPAIAALYAFFGCPILYFTGLPCLGCGMTRAFFSLCHLDFGSAFDYHPLIFLMPVIVLLFFFRKKTVICRMKKVLFVCVVGLFMLVYIYRMFWGSGTVVSVAVPRIYYDIQKLFFWR